MDYFYMTRSTKTLVAITTTISTTALFAMSIPAVKAQYYYNPTTMQVTTAAPTTSTTTSSSTSATSMGQPVALLSAPTLSGLPTYASLGTFISGHSFPAASTGPITTLFMSSSQVPTTAFTNVQTMLTSNGWTINTAQSAGGTLAATLGNLSCKFNVTAVSGRDKTRIYVTYAVNNQTTTTTTSTTMPTTVPTQ